MTLDDEFKRGPRTWKFNNTLLQDENYLKLIKDCYPRILQKNAEINDKQLLWELIKMEIRSETILYSKRKTSSLKSRELIVQNKLQELYNKICNESSLDQNVLLEYESLKKKLNELYDIKGKGAIFRSKVNWFEKGEKPTKYFFSLQKTNFEKKIITQLKIGDEEILSDFKQVNNEIENFYSEFYKSNFESLNKGEVQEKFIAFVDGLDITRLSNDESEELDYELSIAEIRNAPEAAFRIKRLRVTMVLPKSFTRPSSIS